MAEKKILVVEDDEHISRLVKYNLEKAGFGCIVVSTGEKSLEVLNREAVDLVILDIMLPEMDGFQVCKQVRKEEKFSAIPIIMLTAKGEEVDRVVGFELGADDYIVKPFSVRELVLRVKAILKRGRYREVNKDILMKDKLRVDISKHKVFIEEKEIYLTQMEFKLLTTLMQRKGKVQTRDVLLDNVWDMNTDVTTRTIDTHIKRLRHKLGKIGKLIETVRGVGYRFSEES